MSGDYRLDLHEKLIEHYERLRQSAPCNQWYNKMIEYHQEKISHPDRVTQIPTKEQNDRETRTNT